MCTRALEPNMPASHERTHSTPAGAYRSQLAQAIHKPTLQARLLAPWHSILALIKDDATGRIKHEKLHKGKRLPKHRATRVLQDAWNPPVAASLYDCTVASMVAFPAATFSASTGGRLGKPMTYSLVQRGPPGAPGCPFRAADQVEHGVSHITPATMSARIHLVTISLTAGLVRSPCGPDLMSIARALRPRTRMCLFVPALPANSSRKKRSPGLQKGDLNLSSWSADVARLTQASPPSCRTAAFRLRALVSLDAGREPLDRVDGGRLEEEPAVSQCWPLRLCRRAARPLVPLPEASSNAKDAEADGGERSCKRAIGHN